MNRYLETTDPLAASFTALSRDECLAALQRGRVGRLAVVVGGQPHVLPLNYAATSEGVIVFRTAELTVANGAALAKVAFEVDAIDLERHEGWSVVVHGYGRDISHAIDPVSEHLRHMPVQPWAPGQRQRWFKITPTEVTGRRLEAAALAALPPDGARYERWIMDSIALTRLGT